MTCWCSSFPLPWQRRPHTAPTSHYDLLVLFLPSPLTMAVTHSTNKSLQLVGAFSFFSLNHSGHTQHQQVVKTRWCLSIPLPQPWQSLTAPMSHCDSLVPFLSSPSTMVATHSTNESLWLIGAFPSLSLNYGSHTQHQWVIMTRWCFFFIFPWQRQPHTPITETSSWHTATTTLLTCRASHATTCRSISLVVFLFYFNSKYKIKYFLLFCLNNLLLVMKNEI